MMSVRLESASLHTTRTDSSSSSSRAHSFSFSLSLSLCARACACVPRFSMKTTTRTPKQFWVVSRKYKVTVYNNKVSFFFVVRVVFFFVSSSVSSHLSRPISNFSHTQSIIFLSFFLSFVVCHYYLCLFLFCCVFVKK